jgi:hypothetical protein
VGCAGASGRLLIREKDGVGSGKIAYEMEVTLQPLCAAALHIRLPVCYVS